MQVNWVCQSGVWIFYKNDIDSNLESLMVARVESCHSVNRVSSRVTIVSQRDSRRVAKNRDSCRVIDSSHAITGWT